jgi:amino acid transporter
VKYFGEVEFGAACIKTVTIVGLMILCLVIDLGGSPQGRIGFRYWNNPGAFKEFLVEGSTGRFLGFWASVTNAAFAYMGSEMVGMTFGEASKPWRTIPKAINATFWRISFFYIGGVFCLGLVVSSSSDRLINATKASTGAGKLLQKALVLARGRQKTEVGRCLAVCRRHCRFRNRRASAYYQRVSARLCAQRGQHR